MPGKPHPPPPVPEQLTLPALREAASGCRACDLWERGTQTVFGEGAAHARVMLVGEQPGDREDKEGRPFVGPAGMLLDRALDEAGIDRRAVYVTNAVKHFKWEPLLREPDEDARHAAMELFVRDLRAVARLLSC